MELDCPAWGGIDPRAARGVFRDLTTYLDQPIKAITRMYWDQREGEDAVAQQRVAEAADERPVVQYYAQTRHYLYELSYWEACYDKQMWFRVIERACRKYRFGHILDFGGGIGGLTLYLNTHGIQCDYLDVGGVTMAYAASRFARHGLHVPTYDVTSRTTTPKGGYDAVVAWDVLEHLFDLEDAIRQIGALLRPGGWVMSKSTFAIEGGRHEAIHLKRHACYGDVRRLNELFRRHHLHFVGQLKPSRVSRFLRMLGRQTAVTGIRIAPRLKHGGNFLVHERIE